MHYRKLVKVGCKLDFFIKGVCRAKNNCNLQSQNTLCKTKARTLQKKRCNMDENYNMEYTLFYSSIPFLVIGIIGNVLVIRTVHKTREMHTPTNYLLVSMATSDIITIFFVVAVVFLWSLQIRLQVSWARWTLYNGFLIQVQRAPNFGSERTVELCCGKLLPHTPFDQSRFRK